MKKFMIPGAAAVATAALSLLLGGGVANAQEAAQAPAPVQVPAIHVVDALDSAIKDAPQARLSLQATFLPSCPTPSTCWVVTSCLPRTSPRRAFPLW